LRIAKHLLQISPQAIAYAKANHTEKQIKENHCALVAQI
jgi:hypothetical protein